MSEECRFYYYDNGYSCRLKRESEGDSSIDSDTVHRYCWGYHYEECPRFKRGTDSSGGCFLTSACAEAKGLPDDCRELTVLRHFRDSYMRSTEEGRKDVAQYYAIAPRIVSAIKASPEPLPVFERLYQELVLPCVDLIDAEKYADAHALYRAFTLKLREEFAPAE